MDINLSSALNKSTQEVLGSADILSLVFDNLTPCDCVPAASVDQEWHRAVTARLHGWRVMALRCSKALEKCMMCACSLHTGCHHSVNKPIWWKPIGKGNGLSWHEGGADYWGINEAHRRLPRDQQCKCTCRHLARKLCHLRPDNAWSQWVNRRRAGRVAEAEERLRGNRDDVLKRCTETKCYSPSDLRCVSVSEDEGENQWCMQSNGQVMARGDAADEAVAALVARCWSTPERQLRAWVREQQRGDVAGRLAAAAAAVEVLAKSLGDTIV